MRGRLRRKLAKRRALDKLKTMLSHFAVSGVFDNCATKDEAQLKARCMLFLCDFEVYKMTGKPLLEGFRWIKKSDGPDLVWRGR